MAGPRRRRSMKQLTNTKSFASTIPLKNDNASNIGVSSTIVEVSENVPLENDTNTGVLSTIVEASNTVVEASENVENVPDTFQEKSIRNSKNRACLTTLPRSSSISLLGYGDIDLHKAEFTDKNGNWVDEEREDKYQLRMEFLRMRLQYAQNIWTTLGYIRGNGRGPKPPKKVRSSSTILPPLVLDEQMQNELTKTKGKLIQATKKLDETGKELVVTKKKLNRQEKMIDWMKGIVIEKFGMTLPTLYSDDEYDDGDWKTVEVWQDRWLEGMENGMISSKKPDGCQILMVNQLIKDNHWDIELM
ncbi:hypothetical protein ACH5RR_037064 [Cinchona calisaya]|uniref:Uncharacterized protein n=1 Tax=Cinchona calisaya TaxID=153742 RepID=A0ABD2Y9W6_9GENT